MSSLLNQFFRKSVKVSDPSLLGHDITWQSEPGLSVGDIVHIDGAPVEITSVEMRSILPTTYKGRFRAPVPESPLQTRVRTVRYMRQIVSAMLIDQCHLSLAESDVMVFVQTVMAAVTIEDCCLRLRLLRAKCLDAEGCRVTQGIGPLLWQAREEFESQRLFE